MPYSGGKRSWNGVCPPGSQAPIQDLEDPTVGPVRRPLQRPLPQLLSGQEGSRSDSSGCLPTRLGVTPEQVLCLPPTSTGPTSPGNSGPTQGGLDADSTLLGGLSLAP